MRMRFHTASYLTIAELAQQFSALSTIAKATEYQLALTDGRIKDVIYVIDFLRSEIGGSPTPTSAYYYRRPERFDELRCVAIKHDSPGIQDFEGSAKLVRGVFDLIRDVIFIQRGKELHSLEVSERREKIKYLAAQRLSLLSTTLRDAGVPFETTQEIILTTAKSIVEIDNLCEMNKVYKVDLIDDRMSFAEQVSLDGK